MLVWSRAMRRVIWVGAAVLIGLVWGMPLAVVGLAAFAGEWNGILPVKPTLEHFAYALSSEHAEAIGASVITGFVAGLAALVAGTWAALALRPMTGRAKSVLSGLFFLPSAVPSVSVGLGLLVAFSRPPLILNGTTAIVVIAHFVMIFAFTFGNVSAGLARLTPDFELVAESLGARPVYRLVHVTLPLMLPQLAAAFSLGFALSMGELGATVMIYPPGWVTLPVGIFALTDRGEIFDGAALAILLVLVTGAALALVARLTARRGQAA